MPDPSIEDLIEASSLGTPEAKVLRDSVPAEQVRRVVELARLLADPSVRLVRCRDDWRAHPISDDCQGVDDVGDYDPSVA